MRLIIKKNNWKEEIRANGDCDIFWMGLPLRADDLDVCLRAYTNRFPGMNELAHKT